MHACRQGFSLDRVTLFGSFSSMFPLSLFFICLFVFFKFLLLFWFFFSSCCPVTSEAVWTDALLFVNYKRPYCLILWNAQGPVAGRHCCPVHSLSRQDWAWHPACNWGSVTSLLHTSFPFPLTIVCSCSCPPLFQFISFKRCCGVPGVFLWPPSSTQIMTRRFIISFECSALA